jgi:hypothetical protein
MSVFPGGVFGWVGTLPEGGAVKSDARPAGADELTDVAVTVTCGILQNLLVVLAKQLQRIRLIEIAVLAKTENPAGACVFAGGVGERTILKATGLKLKMLLNEREGILEAGVACVQGRQMDSHRIVDLHYL